MILVLVRADDVLSCPVKDGLASLAMGLQKWKSFNDSLSLRRESINASQWSLLCDDFDVENSGVSCGSCETVS